MTVVSHYIALCEVLAQVLVFYLPLQILLRVTGPLYARKNFYISNKANGLNSTLLPFTQMILLLSQLELIYVIKVTIDVIYKQIKINKKPKRLEKSPSVPAHSFERTKLVDNGSNGQPEEGIKFIPYPRSNEIVVMRYMKIREGFFL